MNLVINGIQSMASVTDRPRELLIRSCEGEDDQVMIEVRDRGSRHRSAGYATSCSMPSSPPSPTGWEWDCRSAVPSSRRTGADMGIVQRWAGRDVYVHGAARPGDIVLTGRPTLPSQGMTKAWRPSSLSPIGLPGLCQCLTCGESHGRGGQRRWRSMTEAFETEAIVFVVDDDPSMRKALSNLFRSVGLRAEVFGSAREWLESKLPGGRQLPGPGHPVAGTERPGLSSRAGQGEYSNSDYFHDRPRRYPDDGEGHEGWSGRFPDQAVSRPGHARRRRGCDRARSHEGAKKRKSLRSCAPFSRR